MYDYNNWYAAWWFWAIIAALVIAGFAWWYSARTRGRRGLGDRTTTTTSGRTVTTGTRAP